jgi:hypothetical protein
MHGTTVETKNKGRTVYSTAGNTQQGSTLYYNI